MRQQRKSFWRRCRRPGLTLLECLVAMVILGVILSSTLMTRARYLHQAATAKRQAEAITAADALLVNWEQLPSGPPRQDEGAVEQSQGLLWRTHLVDNASVNGLGAQVLRLEIVDGQLVTHVSPLAFVDVVVPRTPAHPTSAPAAGPGGSNVH